jgi:pre-mRNA-processing factor 17
MNLIGDYGDDDETEAKKIVLAPSVSLKPTTNTTRAKQSKEITSNLKVEQMYRPTFGPQNPTNKKLDQNLLTGNAEHFNMNDNVFKMEFEEKSKLGVSTTKLKRKKGVSDPTKSGYLGPWASYDQPVETTQDFDDEFYEDILEEPEQKKKVIEPKEPIDKSVPKFSTKFYLKETQDYQGRTFIAPPSGYKPGTHPLNYLPKQKIHTYSSHSKNVTAVEFFPIYGHLLLSASADSSIKIWDVMSHRSLIRDYLGHEKGVKCINFQADGKVFGSGGYDNLVRLWDTETGQVKETFTHEKTPLVIKMHPDKKHSVFIGTQDKKILQYDTRSNQVVQKYEGHAGPINSINFLDNLMISTAEDKSLRVWEYGIPVVYKYVSDHSMQSIVSVAIHPKDHFLIAQSMDSHIHVFDTDKWKIHKGKKFVGHVINAYHCQVGFSNDGKYVISGDQEGKLWIWDYKSTKKMKTFKSHEGVCIGAQWHPIETSKIVTCGYDNEINLFD